MIEGRTTRSPIGFRWLKTAARYIKPVQLCVLVSVVISLCRAPLLGAQPIVPVAATSQSEPVSIRDCIEMSRIPIMGFDGAQPVFDHSGKQFVSVVWRGNLAKSVNEYQLLLFRAGSAGGPFGAPTTLLTVEYPGDPTNQTAGAIRQPRFSPDDKSISFVGRFNRSTLQVYSVDIASGKVSQLTHSSHDVVEYAFGSAGRVSAYVTLTPTASVFEPLEQELFLFPDSPDKIADVFKARWFENEQGLKILADRQPASNEPVRLFSWRSIPHPAIPSLLEVDAWDPANGASGPSGRGWEQVGQSRAVFVGSPTGEYAVFWPFSFADCERYASEFAALRGSGNKTAQEAYELRMKRYQASAYGLVDLRTGEITRLLDAPAGGYTNAMFLAPPIWSANGKSVVVQSYVPNDKASRAKWLEVEMADRRTKVFGELPEGWTIVSMARDGSNVVAARRPLDASETSLAILKRRADGTLGELFPIRLPVSFNSNYDVGTNGETVVGVTDSLSTPPEIASFNLTTGKTSILTDLNPQLRQRMFGEVSEFTWTSSNDTSASGFLTKPVGWTPGKRYPLVIFLEDRGRDARDHSFVMDGTIQLSAYAIQTLASKGAMVLLTPSPPSIRAHTQTPSEAIMIQEYIESAIDQMDKLGLIDQNRVSLSGWSRAGFYTDAILIHSKYRFAAASKVDGGGTNYLEGGGRPWTKAELAAIHTPLLIEEHGNGEDNNARAGVLDKQVQALTDLGKPVERLFIRNAPHATMNPADRWVSLNAHTDWLLYWLTAYEDPDPAKRDQYARWSVLRAMQEKVMKGAQ